MITDLTRFCRLTLRKSGELITIRDELEIAGLYLNIEKLCHNHELSWRIDLEDGIKNFMICKFTVSACDRFDYAKQAIRASVYDYIEKPGDYGYLKEKTEGALALIWKSVIWSCWRKAGFS